MSSELKRATGLLVIEVVNSNPNGDPDRESDPRQRPNGLGEISPVSFKRKLRDLLDDHDAPFFRALPEQFSGNPDHYFILEHRGLVDSEITKEQGNDPAQFMNSPFVHKYWDARVFGNTFLEENKSKADKEESKDKASKKESKGGQKSQGVYQNRCCAVWHGYFSGSNQHYPSYEYKKESDTGR